jgi:uncharacterized protein (TIGR01777 family)
MRVVVAGSTGFLGTMLVSSLRQSGCHVVRLVRRSPTAPDEHRWDPITGWIAAEAFADADAVVNLCGAGIADRRWSAARKQVLRDSRIEPTEVLACAVAEHGVPTLVNASAVGYYGDTGEQAVDESSPAGTGFVATLCQDWENATEPAAESGARVIRLRTGLALSATGGLLGRVKPLFALMLGTRFGAGTQYMSWVHVADWLSAVRFVLDNTSVAGPVNVCSPYPVTNASFTKALGAAVKRPAPWVAPAFAVRAVLGELADEALLAGQRVLPKVLQDNDFQFRYAAIDDALADVVMS